jgi:nanoRNase/pAp phosphatase (c-di-AMP/oligoRNAs hydrolase)
MSLSPTQQAQEYISRAKHILVITNSHPSIDTVASATAMGLFLQALNKSADIVIPSFNTSNTPAFIEGKELIKSKIGAMRALHISIDVSKTPIEELLYDIRDGKLEINVIPKQNEWNLSDISTTHGTDRYDLVITLDVPDIKSLGAYATQYADFFHRTTIINIDSNPSNEHWGQINIINLNAVSVSEVLFELFQEWHTGVVNAPIATNILAGMIAKTRSFKTPNVTPRTLSTSSSLVGMGAKRNEIVDGLWRTRSINTLKLWGRALARLHDEGSSGIVWTMLAQKDFLESGTGSEMLPDVIDELITYVPEAKIIALFYEDVQSPDRICVIVAATPPHQACNLVKQFNATGTHERASFCMEKTKLIDAANSVISMLKKSQIPNNK